MKPTILIADDDIAFLGTLTQVIGDAGFRVLAVPGGQKAVETFWAEDADVVLLDFRMPDLSGIDAMLQIRELRPSVPVYMMSGQGDIPIAVSAIKRGACDFFVKPIDYDELIAVLKEAISKLKPDDQSGVAEKTQRALSEREMEILTLTSEGDSGRTIGERLSISQRTVETYRERIMKKIGVKTKSEMIRFAINNGFLHVVK